MPYPARGGGVGQIDLSMLVSTFPEKQIFRQLNEKNNFILSLIGIIWDEAFFFFLIWELIFIYCGLFPPHLGSFFLCCFFFHYVSAKFHLWPTSSDLPEEVITGDMVTRLSIPIRGRSKSPEEGQCRQWRLLVQK